MTIGTESIISILGLIVSILGLILSFIIINKDNAKLVVEKELLETKLDKKELWLYFYISNIGKRPATIKKIEFYNPETKFMPNTTCVKVFESASVGIDLGTAPSIKNYGPVIFPLVINSNDTLRVLAKLNFTNEDTFNQEINQKELKYIIKIDYSNKKHEQLI